jgi:hypothetical protein
MMVKQGGARHSPDQLRPVKSLTSSGRITPVALLWHLIDKFCLTPQAPPLP